MQWSFPDIHELAKVLVATGQSFFVRRTLRRLESGELNIGKATETLKAFVAEHRFPRLPPEGSLHP